MHINVVLLFVVVFTVVCLTISTIRSAENTSNPYTIDNRAGLLFSFCCCCCCCCCGSSRTQNALCTQTITTIAPLHPSFPTHNRVGVRKKALVAMSKTASPIALWQASFHSLTPSLRVKFGFTPLTIPWMSFAHPLK
ncbi:MAG: hypothetical protein JOS17DRAFT_730501 [Linnemannia elongata]|nr:MAG: hypothetical protein JOS17DRAFT_730501 [Linnemannia elongata]